MLTYSLSEFEATPDRIISALDKGEVVCITLGGKLWAKLTPEQHLSEQEKESLPIDRLRGIFSHRTKLREATEEDFQSVKTMWRIPIPGQDEMPHGSDG